MRRLPLLICLLIYCPVFAQEIGPEAPILGKGTLGLNGLAVLEVALPTEYSYNPAAVPFALKLFKEKQYAEIDRGTLDFEKGPKVRNIWQLYVFQPTSDSAIRLARYTVSSNSRPIAYLGPGPSVSFDGQTLEITYGRLLSQKFGLGIAMVPYEKIRTFLTSDGVTLGQGEAKSDLHYRIGGLYMADQKFSFGAVYTHDEIEAITFLFPELTGLPAPVRLQGDFKEKLWTTGVAYQPRLGTVVFFAWQKGDIKGPNLSEGIDLWAFGIQQFFNPKLAIRVGLYDRVPGYAITYYDHGWNFGASYARKTYRRTEEYLGRANTLYLWAGKGW